MENINGIEVYPRESSVFTGETRARISIPATGVISIEEARDLVRNINLAITRAEELNS